MGLSAKTIQKRWDANVAKVQEAKADVDQSRRAYATACDTHAAMVAPLRRRMWMGQLTEIDVERVDAAEAIVNDARADLAEARLALATVQEMFKAGVIE